MNRTTILLIVLYAAISVYIGHWASDACYYLGAQFNECLLLFLLSMHVSGFARTLATTLLILATFELIDEIAGRNTLPYFNDYIPIAVATIYLIWTYLRKK